MRIALDAMGGDLAPQPNLDGAVAALEADPALEIVLTGRRPELEPWLETVESDLASRIEIAHADDVVGMEEKPTDALRKKPNSSIAVCWRLMAGQDVDALVSAGNTGAVVAAGLRTRLFLKGVKRPGIAVALPTATGRSVLLDVGANPAARPEHLCQYAVMGSIYAREMIGIEAPRVGLMNIGTEDGKGNELYRLAYEGLANSPLKDRFIGNVEGRGLYRGEADVLVCEGFVGNVVLKVSEGMAEFMLQSVGTALTQNLSVERNSALDAVRRMAGRFQYSESGGAPLLGIDGVCIICHGSSDARSIANALKGAAAFQHRHINAQITEELTARTRAVAQ